MGLFDAVKELLGSAGVADLVESTGLADQLGGVTDAVAAPIEEVGAVAEDATAAVEDVSAAAEPFTELL
jgi:methyl-accepting chemotaxis protein